MKTKLQNEEIQSDVFLDNEAKLSPFTSKGYPFRKDFSSYEAYWLGRAFFSDGYVDKRGRLELFDNANILSGINLKDESLFYKKLEIPVYIFTTDSVSEAKDKYDKLDINYDEIALFLVKENQQVDIMINLGDSLLKLSNLKNEEEMKNKRWSLPEDDISELKKDFSAKKIIAFLNKHNELFNEEIENVTGLFPPKKTKVHFTIGLFFDGTGNNRFNSEANYYKKLNASNLVYKEIPPLLEINTEFGSIKIDNSSSYWNSYSNVVLLHDLYETKTIINRDNSEAVTIKQYVEGIGTLQGEEDDLLGSAFGEGKNGVIGKVATGCNDVAKQIKEILGNDKQIGSLTFDVFGFSRGAAAARHFCNEILNQTSMEMIEEKAKPDSSSKNQGNTRVANKIKYLPIGKKYKLGLLGKALKNNDAQNEITEFFNEEPKVKVRFLGLFDTVLSQFIVKDNFGKKLDLVFPFTKIPYGIGNYIETKLDVIEQRVDDLAIDTVVHFVAKDELRENFPSTRINVQAFNKNKDKKGFEYLFDGAHSDVGGSYAAMKQDVDILDFETKTNFAEYEIYSPDKLYKLRDFYIANGLCSESEISVQLVSSFLETMPGQEDIQVWNYQLIAKRNIIPRYSVISMYAMKKLAELSDVNFDESLIKSLTHKFEYDIPKTLVKFANEKIENIKDSFQGKEEKKMKNKLSKNKFIHLSSNYNASKGIKRKGSNITSNRTIDKIFYINSPHYANAENNSYKREIYTHDK